MLDFDSKTRLLKMRKVQVPSLNVNVMRDLQESFYNYINKTIYEDVKQLEFELQKLKDMANVTLDVEVGSVIRQDYLRNQVKNSNIYIPVNIQMRQSGYLVGPKLELLRIPYMDDYGKINVKGNSKVVMSVQRTSEDISYDLKDGKFNVSMPYANLCFKTKANDILVRYGSSNISIIQLIAAMCYNAGVEVNLKEYFASTYLKNLKYNNEYISFMLIANSPNLQNICNALKSEQYKLGATRLSLNEAFQLDHAVGEVLSRDVLSYKRGTSITTAMVNEFKKNLINEVYVLNNSGLSEGLILGKSSYMFVDMIPAGTIYIPELDQYNVPTDGVVDSAYTKDVYLEEPITFYPGEVLDDSMIRVLNALGISKVTCVTKSGGAEKEYSTEREICGNYTVQRKYVQPPKNATETADDWVYYYNNPNLDNVEHDHLTPHDIMAIASTMGQTYTSGYTPILNRDTAYLKKVYMIGDLFSEAFRKVVPTFVKKYKRNISDKFSDPEATDLFVGFTKHWLSYMNESRYLATVDSTNLTSELAQVTRISTLVDTASVKDVMRRISMLHLGRLCPFATPAGKKLGLVNSQAVGAKLQNNLLLTPYRKVLATATGIRVSDKIEYLSIKQELKVKVCDILSLISDGKGGYINNKINARVPNPNKYDDEKLIIATIDAHDMAGGYVLADPEQILSITATLIPFACSNNANRNTFGMNQNNQAIYLHNSTIPRVITQGHKDMFNYSRCIYAPVAGRILSVDKTRIILLDNFGVERKIQIASPITRGQLDVIVVLNVSEGNIVQEDDVLAELVVNPQFFVVKAPFSGYISKIAGDHIVIQKKGYTGGNSFVMLDDEGEYTDRINTTDCRIMGQSAIFMNFNVSEGDYVNKGDILATTSMSREGIYSPSRSALVAYIFFGYNYEDGVLVSERFSADYTSLIAHSVKKEINKKREPDVIPSQLSGYKYCRVNDIIATYEKKVAPDAPEVTPLVKTHIRATHKTQGIPFERSVTVLANKNKEYTYTLLGFNKLSVGDKLAGRHGNKGVTTKILPNSTMPTLANGMFVDCVFNPCGVPSRMNLGQIWEAHLGLICKVLDIYADSGPYNGASPEEITLLMKYTYELANTDGIENRSTFNSIVNRDVYNSIPKDLHEHCYGRINDIVVWRGCFNERGDAELFDPITGEYFEGRVTIGYPYILKMMQEADEKINYRAGALYEQYSRTTSQPQPGVNSAKGQRVGEMELMAYAAYGAKELIREMLNEKCDNLGAKYNMYIDRLNLDYPKIPAKYCTPRATETLIYMLEGMGIKAEVTNDIADVSTDASREKFLYNLPKMLAEESKRLDISNTPTHNTVKVLNINEIEE